MKLTHSVRYDASLADVRAMLMDPAFREKSANSQGATAVEVSIDGGVVQVEMDQPTDDLPGFARKIVGDSSHLVQSENWTAEDTADFSVTIPPLPGSLSGIRTLKADGDGTLDTFDGEATVKIPLVGGKLESLIGAKFKEGWANEHAVGTAWLAGDR